MRPEIIQWTARLYARSAFPSIYENIEFELTGSILTRKPQRHSLCNRTASSLSHGVSLLDRRGREKIITDQRFPLISWIAKVHTGVRNVVSYGILKKKKKTFAGAGGDDFLWTGSQINVINSHIRAPIITSTKYSRFFFSTFGAKKSVCVEFPCRQSSLILSTRKRKDIAEWCSKIRKINANEWTCDLMYGWYIFLILFLLVVILLMIVGCGTFLERIFCGYFLFHDMTISFLFDHNIQPFLQR